MSDYEAPMMFTRISFRASEAEAQRYDMLAGYCGMLRSEWLRTAARLADQIMVIAELTELEQTGELSPERAAIRDRSKADFDAALSRLRRTEMQFSA